MTILDQKLGETSVSIGDVQKFLVEYASLKENEASISDASQVRIGVGQGFVSHIFKLTLTWDKTHPKLPEHIVVKIPTMQNLIVATESVMDSKDQKEKLGNAMEKFLPTFHKAECDFYETFRHESPVPIPHIYYTQEISAGKPGIIAMEDFTVSDGVNVSMFTGYRLEQLFHLTECLADLQAHSLNNREWVDKFPMPDVETFREFFSMMDNMMSACTALNPHFTKEKLEKFKPFMDLDVMKRTMDVFFERENLEYCLVHGDLWFNNLFFKKDENLGTSDNVLAIIDWQATHKGSPIEDLGRMMVSSVPADIRRRYTNTVLHHFYDRLCSQVSKPPYTFDKLVKYYNDYFPLATAFFVFGLPMMAGPQSPMFAGKPEDEVARCKKAMWNRGEAALDDAVELIDSGRAQVFDG